VIPVASQGEPAHFHVNVRQRGQAFLKTATRPTPEQWSKHSYWRSVTNDLREAYSSICAYSAQWIPRVQGGSSVDHFVPKSADAGLAYEWANYRLASQLCNSRKGDHRDVLDPFSVAADSFVLDFPSLLIAPHLQLNYAEAGPVQATINRLGLNDENCVKSRLDWLLLYCIGDISLAFLKQKAPFIAYELRRQNLDYEIKTIMTRTPPAERPVR
jgi:hypothetical protein